MRRRKSLSIPADAAPAPAPQDDSVCNDSIREEIREAKQRQAEVFLSQPASTAPALVVPVLRAPGSQV